ATPDEINKFLDSVQSISANAEQITAMALSYLRELDATDLKLDEESVTKLIHTALLKLTDDLPMLMSWYAAIEYCNKRSLAEGLTPVYSWQDDEIVADWSANGYRVPTEAEWEYAAQGGGAQQPFEYSGSDDADDVSWHDNNIHLAASKQANTLGLYDLSGNVGEWCWDWHSSFYLDWEHYTGPYDPYIRPPYGEVLAIKPLTDPVGPSYEQVWSMEGIYEARNTNSNYRIVRGGGLVEINVAAWGYPEHFLGVTSRDAAMPAESLEGLRVVRRFVAPAEVK
ncbi:MAG: formylglycine-generating enzyme family protein, partial [Deferribacteraceae bacterium]|nr:formylglycine-generating enzyme family protein [Deferribacteraceae bacterium]